MISLKWTLRTFLRTGVRYSKIIAQEEKLDRKTIYKDFVKCYFKYNLIADQYYVNRVFEMNEEERQKLSEELREYNIHASKWEKQSEKERRFFAKYSKSIYDVGINRFFRNRAYQKRYKAGDLFTVERNVEISRQHLLDGTITIGNNVLICKNCIVDYSGGLVLEDSVSLAEGVAVFSHTHLNGLYNRLAGIKDKAKPEPAKTVIKSGAWVGAGCIVMPGVTIGEDAVILPGSVVTKDIPDKAIASGNPAVIKDLRGRRKRKTVSE